MDDTVYDLHPENMAINIEGNIKIIDYGCIRGTEEFYTKIKTSKKRFATRMRNILIDLSHQISKKPFKFRLSKKEYDRCMPSHLWKSD